MAGERVRLADAMVKCNILQFGSDRFTAAMANADTVELLEKLVKTQGTLIENLETQLARTTRQLERAKERAKREEQQSSPVARPRESKKHAADTEEAESRKKVARGPRRCRQCNTEYTTFSCPSIECQEQLAERKRLKKEQANQAAPKVS